MIAMDKVHSIRQLFYEQGKSVSAIAAETGHDRKTISKYLDMTDFNTPEPKKEDPENMCPKLDAYKPLIDQWLLDDRKAPRKQRHTAKRVFKRLLAESEGFDCSYRLVAQYVAYRKSQMHLDSKKSYLPLIHYPGEAQADFGAAQFFENSLSHEGKYLVLSFPFSNAGYLQLMYGENAECFMEGMIAMFMHLGGVPTEIWFDNTSTLVTKILKDGGRQLTDKFLRFSEHYGFRYKFMNPESGWEKGNVENKVGYSRRNFLVPPPRFMELSGYNSRLLTEADSDMDREHYHYDQTILERFGEDKKALLPLPDVAFDPARYETVLTDKWGRFMIIPGFFEPPVRTFRFFRNYPFPLLLIYLNLASSNRLPQRPYIVLFIILSLLFVPSTKPLLYSYATAFSIASISRLNPSAKLFGGFRALLLYFSTNKYNKGTFRFLNILRNSFIQQCSSLIFGYFS